MAIRSKQMRIVIAGALVLLALQTMGSSATAEGGSAPQVKAMVWPVEDRSPAFDRASVDEVLAEYESAYAVLATPAQLGRLRAQHFLIDMLPPAAARTSAAPSMGPQTMANDAPALPYHIVTFIAPPTPGWIQRVEALGGWQPVASALSGQSIVFRLDDAGVASVQELKFVESVMPYPSEGRLAPEIGVLPGDALVNVSILLFDPADALEVAQGIEAMGGTLLSRGSPEGVLIILANVRQTDAADLAGRPQVRLVESYIKPILTNNVASGIIGVENVRSALGLTGTGQIIAVADTGLDTGNTATVHHDFAGRIVAHFGYGRPSPPGPDPTQIYTWSDPDGHGTHVAGSVLGDGTRSAGGIQGMAPDAGLVIQSLLDGSGGLGGVAAGYTTILGDAYNQGARIQTNSWGFPCAFSCPYSSREVAYDDFLFTNPDLFVLFAAGNAGRDTDGNGVVDSYSLNSPSIAKNVLTVGASENLRPTIGSPYFSSQDGYIYGFPVRGDTPADDASGLAAFSSRGPTSDGRIKPDLVAPGTYIASTRSSVAPASSYNLGVINAYYAWESGTSMATPITAGAAAIVREGLVEAGFTNPSAALVKANLINSADNLAPGQYGTGATRELGAAPDYNQGWGRLDVESLLLPPSPMNTIALDHKVGLSTGQFYPETIRYNDNSVPLQVTLVWSDAAGSPNCTTCLVNNLNLVVVGPTGTEYHGNQFVNVIGSKAVISHTSARNPIVFDGKNNVERFQIPAGSPIGEYALRVNAASVPTGPQPFALAISGAFGPLTDLGVLSSTSLPSPPVGVAYDLTLAVTNDGPDGATGVTLTDTLPSGMAYGVAVASQGTCNRVGTVLACNLGALADGATATVTMPLTGLAAGNKANTATVASDLPAIDPDSSDNTALLTTVIRTPSADLAVTNTDSTDPLLVGKPLTYTVTVTNNGPDDAPGVTLTDTLPSAMAYGTPVASQGTCNRVTATVTCILGPLANGASATFTFPMTPTAAGTATNTAVAAVTGGGIDPSTANNRALQATSVRAPQANLAVANADSADPVLAGSPLTYTVTVTNNGPDDAPGVTLVDTLPSGMTYGAIATSHGTCARVTATVTCLLGGLANGQSATLTFAMTPTVAAVAVTNTATASVTGGIDPATTDNRLAQVTRIVAPATDLAVTNVDDADPILTGRLLTYTVTVTNNGPDDAPAVKLVDTLPTGMTYGTPTTTQGSCARVGTAVTCLMGAMANGATATVTLPMTPTVAAAAATNTAVVTAMGGAVDSALGNNRAVQAVRVNAPSANLMVTNVDDTDPILTGRLLTYTVTVTNNGPDDAPGVTLADTLPAGMAYGTFTSSQGSCTRVGTAVTCPLGPLPNGQTATLTFPMTPTVAATAATNTAVATLTGGAIDPVVADNRVAQATRVNAPATNLAVTNVDDVDPILAGKLLTYTVTVTNNGPDDAPGVTLQDTLPSGMAYGTTTTSQGTCTRVSTIVTCLLGPLANGETATVTLPMTPTAAATAATHTAVASVTGGAVDPALTDNRAAQATRVNAPSTNLVVTNVDDVDPVFAGKPLTYTVTVFNNGPDDAPGVTLTDTLPAGMVYGTPTTSQGTCNRISTTVTCLLGPLVNGATATLTFPMTPTTPAPAATNAASATVTGGGLDPQLTNNRVSQATRVNAPSTNLAVTNLDSADPAPRGVPFTYEVTVTNNGPDDAPGITLTTSLPTGATYGSITASQGTCNRVTTTVTCQLGPLVNGAIATVSIPVTPTTTGAKTSTASASVTGGGVDPSLADNRVTTATTFQ